MRSSLVSSPYREFEGRHQFLNSSGQHPLKFDFFARFCCYSVFHFESRTVSNFLLCFSRDSKMPAENATHVKIF